MKHSNHPTLQRVSVLGAGGFGTAMAILLGQRRDLDCVCLWARSEERAREIRGLRENRRYLPDAKIPDSVKITADLSKAAACADALVLAAPSHGVRELCARLKQLAAAPKLIVNLAKGIEIPQPRGRGAATPKRMSEVAAETLGRPILSRYVALSGPGFAAEIARGLPVAMTAASRHTAAARAAQGLLMGETLRIYTSTDLAGVELGGALKNVIAIAAGVCDGLGLGDSAKATLITRGLVEMARLGVALGGRTETFYGLSGAGDLMDTCFSRHSRNRGLGERLGRGESLKNILGSMTMVAEGVRTARAVAVLARRKHVEAPILAQTYAILYRDKQPRQALRDLMSRAAKAET